MSPEEMTDKAFSILPEPKEQPLSGSRKKKKLIIDADPGIVDAFTILVALLDPEIEVLALTATAGIVSGSMANQNLQTIINRIVPPKYPRLGFCDEQLAETIPAIREVPNPLLMGETGLGDCPTTAVSLASPHKSAKVMVECVRLHPGEVTVLTLGPMTNISLACEIAPEFLQEVKSIICLGGSINHGGDTTAAAEGNIFADPEAARYLFKADCHKSLVPLDVTDKLRLTFGDLDRLPKEVGSPVTELINDLLPFALRAARRHLGQEGIALRGIAALTAFTRPQLFSRRLMAVDVEIAGELTRGMTVVDRRGLRHELPNIEVLSEIDHRAAFDYFTGVLWNAIENGA